ncbi:MAG TPA: SpoIIE family protein phosphatase [Ilumatobacteraceae bacterium]|nr:SpoIIE family protein phosphatase [Ilumatobacteraceae bacterium]
MSLEDAAFFDEAPCGFVSAAADGTIRRVNQTFATMSGFAPAELVGTRRFSSLLSTGGRIYVETHLAPLLLASGQVRGIALELATAGGERVPVLVNATLARGEDGTVDGIRIAVFEAAERRAYERELLAARERAEEAATRARVLVRTLQETLIPPVVPTVGGLGVAAAYRPAGDGDEVGGDFYDLFQIGDDDWMVAVGDVTGKGIAAATVTALARYTIRAAAVTAPAPASILATLNDVLRQDDQSSRWCTVALGRLTSRRGRWSIELAHGGHPLTLVVDDAGEVRELGVSGTLLGAFAEPRVTSVRRDLDPGDAVVLYTDGVTEARRDGELYGEARLHDAVRQRRGSANGLTYGLLDDVVTFQSGVTSDDIVIVALHVPS